MKKKINFIDELTKALKKGNLKLFFEKLNTTANIKYEGIDEFNHLEGRFEKLEREKLHGTINSNEYDIRFNNILDSTNKLKNKLKEFLQFIPSSNNNKEHCVRNYYVKILRIGDSEKYLKYIPRLGKKINISNEYVVYESTNHSHKMTNYKKRAKGIGAVDIDVVYPVNRVILLDINDSEDATFTNYIINSIEQNEFTCFKYYNDLKYGLCNISMSPNCNKSLINFTIDFSFIPYIGKILKTKPIFYLHKNREKTNQIPSSKIDEFRYSIRGIPINHEEGISVEFQLDKDIDSVNPP